MPLKYNLSENIKEKWSICSFEANAPFSKRFSKVQSKLFITSLVITEYSLSDIKLLGTDLFPLKFPLYNRIFT